MKKRRLGELRKGESATIVRVAEAAEANLTRRMLEMGLLEGSRVELVHEAPFGGDPVAVRSRGALIALRRLEANFIEVADD